MIYRTQKVNQQMKTRKSHWFCCPSVNLVTKQEERSHTTTTIGGAQTSFLSLRTVPVIVKNGDRKFKVNALLDKASTKTYINCDGAGELRLQGIPRKVTVNVPNGQTETVFKQPRKKLIYLPKNRNMLRDLDLLRDFRVKITQPERHPMLRAWAKVK